METFEFVQDLDLHLMIIIKTNYKNWDNFYILDEQLPKKPNFCVMVRA